MRDSFETPIRLFNQNLPHMEPRDNIPYQLYLPNADLLENLITTKPAFHQLKEPLLALTQEQGQTVNE